MEKHTLQERNAIPLELTWNLDFLYKNTDEWEADFKKIDGLLGKVQSFKGRLAESPSVLRDALKTEDELSLILERIYVYAHLKADEDTGNSQNRMRLDRISSKHAEIEGETAWFEPEMLSMPKEKFGEMMNAPELSFYKRSLEETERERKHTLSEKEERILGMSSDVLSSPYKTFTLLSNADLKFPTITDEKGMSVEITHGNYIKFLENPVREVRKSAFTAMYDTYSKFKNTYSALLDATIKAHVLESDLRGFDSAREASLFADDIPVSVYDGLVSSIRANIGGLHDYFAIRAKRLGLEKLDMFDIHNSLVPEARVEVPWDEAVTDVMDSLAPLGNEYCKAASKAFSERWIDSKECRGKKSGAYSSGCYRRPPYILMNYSGTLDSVFTLAHELGHSMHSYFSDTNQDFHYASYKIFVAEVASTTNELLLHHHLMSKAKDDSVRAYLLNHLIDEVRGTVFRQTMFAEFERDIYAVIEDSGALSADMLSEKYFKLNSDYHGYAVNPDQRIQFEWARIPHFHYNFYVYKYATGFSAAVALSKKILSGETEPYLGFLKAGDSKDVLDIMRDAGVDFSTSAPIDETMSFFRETVTEFSRISG